MKSNTVRTLRSKLTPLLFGLLLLAAAPTVFAQQASAAWGCATNYVCLYEHANYDGIVMNLGNPSPNGTCYYVGAQFNDIISSVHNYTSYDITIYRHSNCSGAYREIDPGQSISKITDLFLNDAVSAYRVTLD